VNNLEPGSVDSLKVVTIRTEKMYDRADINFLGLQFRQTGKRIYGVESEFACPLIVRVYMHPEEEADEDWFEEIVELDVLKMPVHGGGVKETEIDYEFVKMEDEIGMVSAEDLIRMLCNPFEAEFKSRVEENAGKKQYIYEIADADYDKPIYKRYIPYLSNHLSKHDGVIGVYIHLNKDLIPAIQIRYAAPMTAEKLWELMNQETWEITYKGGETKVEGAKMAFSKPGVEYPYINE